MKILNLMAGLGGNVHLLGEEYEVTSVERYKHIAEVNQKLHPKHKVIVGDAMQFLLDNHQDYDIVWASPNCQSHSRMVKATRHDIRKYPEMELYQLIIFLDNFFKGNWIVENVVPYYKPLIEPTLKIGRHLFWSNKFIFGVEDVKRPKGFIDKAEVEDLKKWLGINYEGNLYYNGNHCPAQVLRNCVHPKLGKQLITTLNETI